MATRKQSNDIGRAHGALVEIAGVKARVSPGEWQTRLDLAACYRLVFHYGWHHLNLNHISAAVPGEDGHILINPYLIGKRGQLFVQSHEVGVRLPAVILTAKDDALQAVKRFCRLLEQCSLIGGGGGFTFGNCGTAGQTGQTG